MPATSNCDSWRMERFLTIPLIYNSFKNVNHITYNSTTNSNLNNNLYKIENHNKQQLIHINSSIKHNNSNSETTQIFSY